MPVHLLRRCGCWFSLILLLAACAPSQRAIPTVFVLPSPTHTPVPTVVAPTITPLVITPPPVLPTATRITATPTLTFTPTPRLIAVDGLDSSVHTVLLPRHENCLPQTAIARAVVRSVAPLEGVWLNWAYVGRLSSRPGTAMEQAADGTWTAELGPFEREGTVSYWVVAQDTNGAEAISDTATLTVVECTVDTPTPLPTVGPIPTATPEYGEALSVHALDQLIYVEHNTPTTVDLAWEGGVGPYTIDRITRPAHGTLSGVGPTRVYMPDSGYIGPDSFTFRVLDGNGQAATGTITLQVLPPGT